MAVKGFARLLAISPFDRAPLTKIANYRGAILQIKQANCLSFLGFTALTRSLPAYRRFIVLKWSVFVIVFVPSSKNVYGTAYAIFEKTFPFQ